MRFRGRPYDWYGNDNRKLKEKNAERKADSIDIKRSVRHGHALSAVFFNVVLHSVVAEEDMK